MKQFLFCLMVLLFACGVEAKEKKTKPEFKIVSGKGLVGETPKAYKPIKVGGKHPSGFWVKSLTGPVRIFVSPRNSIKLRGEMQITFREPAGTPEEKDLTQVTKVTLISGKAEVKMNNLKKEKIEVKTGTVTCSAAKQNKAEVELDLKKGEYQFISGFFDVQMEESDFFQGKKIKGDIILISGEENDYAKMNIRGDFKIKGNEGKKRINFEAAGKEEELLIKIVGGSLLKKPAGAYVLKGEQIKKIKSKDRLALTAFFQKAKKEAFLALKKQNLFYSGQEEEGKKLEKEIKKVAKEAVEIRDRILK